MTTVSPTDQSFVPTPKASVHAQYFTENEFAVVLFDAAEGRVIRLNPTASVVWSLVDGAASVREIADEIATIFALDDEEALTSVRRSMDEFRAAELFGGSSSLAPVREINRDLPQLLARAPDP